MAMVTIAAAMATIAEPMGVLDRPHRPQPPHNAKKKKIVGGEPFILLFETITFGAPVGGKEIDVVVNHLRNKKEKRVFITPFLQSVIPRG